MIPIPQFIINELSEHILNKCAFAESGWEYSNEDEDTITGDFFGNLRTDFNYSQNFRWKFYYKKFRGRGNGALEKKIGADGIITIHYHNQQTGEDYYKSLIFQAKKEGNNRVTAQRNKMNLFFPGGNIIVGYGSHGYSAYLNETSAPISLCQTIANDFLNCRIGIRGLYFDSSIGRFIRPDNFAINGTVDHQVIIEIFKS